MATTFLRDDLRALWGEDALFERVFALEGEVYRVGKIGAGYVRQFAPWGGLVPGLGAGVTVSLVPEDLESVYGSRAPLGLQLFFRLRPAPMEGHEAATQPGMDHGDH